MLISPHIATRLPLHDAHILECKTVFSHDGFLQATVRLQLNSAAPLEALMQMGICTSRFCLVFSDCWQIVLNLCGFTTAPESITTFEIVEHSKLRQELLSRGFGNKDVVHFRIQGSSGSQFEFLSDTLHALEAPPSVNP